MKKLLTSLAAFTALTAAASAADLPRRAAPPVFVPVPVFTWTGFYFGINAGYGFDVGTNRGNTFTVPAAFLAAPAGPNTVAFNNSSQEGFTGGGQIGYNYQFTPGSGLVVGVEADAQYVDFGRNRNNVAFNNLAAGFGLTDPRGLASLDYFGTVRGRIGYAFDKVLFYGTGGFAYGSGSAERSFGGFRGNDDFRTGYAAGGGIEYALPTDSFLNFFKSSAVTLKVEGLYVNLDRGTRNANAFVINPVGTPVAFVPGASRRSDEFAVIRAGLNYKFGSY
jgi:outer membrane immunogenic protein